MEALTAIRDTREQDGYTLAPMDLRVEGLQTGDYSVAGLEDMIALERKTLPDLVSCIGSGRERFLRELQRLKAHPFRAVVIEGLWSDLEDGHYQSRLNPDSATHSIISWQSRFCLPFAFVGTREAGERYAREFLYPRSLRSDVAVSDPDDPVSRQSNRGFPRERNTNRQST